MAEIPNQIPTESPACRIALSELRASIEGELTFDQKIERTKIQTKCILQKELERDIKKDPARVDLDHYLLALGYESIRGKTLKFESTHPGSIPYTLLRTGVDLDEALQVDGKTVQARTYIYDQLKSLPEYDDFSWNTLIALDASKRGIKFALRMEDGRELTLAELVKLNIDDFRHVQSMLNRGRETDIFQESLIDNWWGLDKALHCLHAILAYQATLSLSDIRSNYFYNFIFEQIQLSIPVLRKDAVEVRQRFVRKSRGSVLSDRINFVAHLLTPLTEFPRDFIYKEDEKNSLRQIILLLVKDANTLIREESQNNLDPFQKAALAHALDFLNHFSFEQIR